MNHVPPDLPRRPMKLSRDAIVMICAIATICMAVVAWGVSERWQEVQKVRRKSQAQMILNNLRQLSAATDMYYLEHDFKVPKLAQIVGPGKYVKQLSSVDGEDYSKLDLNRAVKTWEITTASGIKVSYRR